MSGSAGDRLAGEPGFRLPRGLGFLHPLALFGAVGERLPRRLRAAAALAHMVQSRRLRLGPRLVGTGEVEVEDGVTMTGNHVAAYSASDSEASGASPPASLASLRLHAAILPRRSSSSS